jgi:8-oxo-dGTP pyrophosphatase MutT (NUDIX family)
VGISDYVRRLRERVGTELLFMPSAACLVRDGDGRVLLVRHVEGRWMMPGGVVDPGETPADAARRESWEEAGVLVEPYALAGVYGGPVHSIVYANGDETAWVVTVFHARILAGEPHPHDDETNAVGWFTPAEAAALEMSSATRDALESALAGRAFHQATWTPE